MKKKDKLIAIDKIKDRIISKIKKLELAQLENGSSIEIKMLIVRYKIELSKVEAILIRQ